MRFVFVRCAILVTTALTLGSLGSVAHAVDAPSAVNVIVVDQARVLHESKAGKAIEAQLQQRYASYQQSLSKQETELASAQQDLQKQQSILAQDAFAAKVKEFEGRYGEARRKAQESQREFVEGENQARAKVLTAVRQILEDMVREHNANLVLDRAAVMIFDSRFEVTDEVIKRLDEKMPTFTVSFPTAAPAAAATAAPGAKKPPPKKPN
jgi:Skp family chaperone for outer membrane proteins